MSNIFRNATQPLHDSPLILFIFLAAVMAFFIGMVHLVEDTISSYYGYQQLVEAFGIVPVTISVTWFTLSIAPMVGQMISAYMYMSDTDGPHARKFWWSFVGFFLVDFVSDLWHRANDGQLVFALYDATVFAFTGNGQPVDFSSAALSLFVAAGFTFFVYTVGAEFFVVVGVGIVGESYLPAATQYGKLKAGIRKARLAVRKAVEDSSAVTPAPRNNSNTTTRP
jgi:hypothetical protein